MSEVEKIELAMALLDEARGFAAMSPSGRDNINEVYDMLPDLIEQAYRRGFVDGEQHASEVDYQRGQEADYNQHIQRLKSEQYWSD